MSGAPDTTLVTRTLLSPRALAYFYRRRLRAHGVQEALAGVGVAAAVALVLAAIVAQSSPVNSARGALRAVIGPADLQLRARGPHGFPEAMLGRVEAIPGVERAAPILERSLRVIAADGRRATVYIAGADTSLGILNGMGRTLPLDALTPGELGLSVASAKALGLEGGGPNGREVTVLVGGVRRRLGVSAVLGRASVGALAKSSIGVMPLQSMQALVGEPGLVARILVQTAPGAHARVAQALRAIAPGRLLVSGSEQDVEELEQALRPGDQAGELFAVVGALLGLLFAFNAILLTVPDRRRAIADLRLTGTRRSAVVQLISFQAICLGAAASLVGVGLGYGLSHLVFHESTGYLAEAFTVSGETVVHPLTVLAVAGGGVAVTWLASAVLLLDLRRGAARDAVYMHGGDAGNTLPPSAERWGLALAAALVTLASVLYATRVSSALVTSVALAVATVLALPVAFRAVLALARWVSERAPRMSTLALALGGVRGTTLRSLALAATGAVALFGSVALGGARDDLVSGIHRFAHAYAADAPIWVSEPGDNQATQQLAGDGGASRIRGLTGVASVSRFQGSFLAFGHRRVWVLARPPGGAARVLASEIVGGAAAARRAEARLAGTGWIVVSQQIAAERHVRVGGTLWLPTPSGPIPFRLAGLTSNLAWSPGVVLVNGSDFARAWGIAEPSALSVHLRSGVSESGVIGEIRRALGPGSGAEVASAATREAAIDRITGEGLGELSLISGLLLLTAVLALAAALASSIHQRRAALAELRLAGARPARLRRMMLVEAALVLGAGAVTGALSGVYGEFTIDAYLLQVSGFPVVGAGRGARPIEILLAVLAAALALVAVPAWLAARVSPALALAEK